MELSRSEAEKLLFEYTLSDSLRRHAYCVEACMQWYARLNNECELLWGITGLLHDFDYEQFPEPSQNGHPFVGVGILRSKGYPESICEAIMGHALYSGVPRISLLAKTLFACDELSGLVYASVLVRPDKNIDNLEVKSVRKKMKDKAFAKGVSREDIYLGCEELGIDLDVHIENVIEAIRNSKTLVF
ncbi:MAG TPA: HAD family hydrolase [Oligoflexia bacterium]|nr:HAD family hydrolase [Oligoflexia bacterium]HMP47192.1 HAD family hydrolase [Oligoflexia bacterium]